MPGALFWSDCASTWRTWSAERNFGIVEPGHIGHTRHAGCQSVRDIPTLAQVAEKHAESCHQQLGTAWAVAIGVAAHEFNDIVGS